MSPNGTRLRTVWRILRHDGACPRWAMFITRTSPTTSRRHHGACLEWRGLKVVESLLACGLHQYPVEASQCFYHISTAGIQAWLKSTPFELASVGRCSPASGKERAPRGQAAWWRSVGGCRSLVLNTPPRRRAPWWEDARPPLLKSATLLLTLRHSRCSTGRSAAPIASDWAFTNRFAVAEA